MIEKHIIIKLENLRLYWFECDGKKYFNFEEWYSGVEYWGVMDEASPDWENITLRFCNYVSDHRYVRLGRGRKYTIAQSMLRNRQSLLWAHNRTLKAISKNNYAVFR